MSKGETLIWTGENLADVKRFYRHVAQYPAEPKERFPRDASQHPDNLHLEIDGQTVIAAKGDTLVKDDEGKVSVRQTARTRPVALAPPTTGEVVEVREVSKSTKKTKGSR